MVQPSAEDQGERTQKFGTLTTTTEQPGSVSGDASQLQVATSALPRTTGGLSRIVSNLDHRCGVTTYTGNASNAHNAMDGESRSVVGFHPVMPSPAEDAQQCPGESFSIFLMLGLPKLSWLGIGINFSMPSRSRPPVVTSSAKMSGIPYLTQLDRKPSFLYTVTHVRTRPRAKFNMICESGEEEPLPPWTSAGRRACWLDLSGKKESYPGFRHPTTAHGPDWTYVGQGPSSVPPTECMFRRGRDLVIEMQTRISHQLDEKE